MKILDDQLFWRFPVFLVQMGLAEQKDARLHLAPGTMPSTPWSMATERTPPSSLGCAQLFDVELQGTSVKDPTSRKPQKKTEIPRLCRSEISRDLDRILTFKDTKHLGVPTPMESLSDKGLKDQGAVARSHHGLGRSLSVSLSVGKLIPHQKSSLACCNMLPGLS